MITPLLDSRVESFNLIALNLNFSDWCNDNGKSITKETLPELLRGFYAGCCKDDGEEHTLVTVRSLRYGLSWHFKALYGVDICKDPEFNTCNSTFVSKLRDLKRIGKDEIHHKQIISYADLLKLKQYLNIDTPQGLLDFVWFNIMFYFGRRAVEGLRELREDFFEVEYEEETNKPLWVRMKVNQFSKNHNGETADDEDEVDPKMIFTGDKHCPVTAFIKYCDKRNKKHDAFFQYPKINWKNSKVWYYAKPIGERALSEKMKLLSEKAKLSKKYTNHCIRATMITILGRSGFSTNEIKSVTKHKAASSLESYFRDMDTEGKMEANQVLASAFKNGKKLTRNNVKVPLSACPVPVSYTHLTLPTKA